MDSAAFDVIQTGSQVLQKSIEMTYYKACLIKEDIMESYPISNTNKYLTFNKLNYIYIRTVHSIFKN